MNIGYLVNKWALSNPGKIAVKHGNQVLSYAQLNAQASQLARYFASINLKADMIAGLAADRCLELPVIFLAFAKAGITYLPLDPTFPADRIDYMLADARCDALIAHKKHEEKFKHHNNVLYIEDILATSKQFDEDDFHIDYDPEGIAYILYTSGSTGAPKGVLVKRAGLFNLLTSVQKSPGIVADDIVLFTTTIAFDIAELEIFLPLIAGAKLIIGSTDMVKDGRALLALAVAEQVTILQGTPFMWRMLLEAGWNDALPLKAFCGGEAMTRELAAALVPLCKELWNMYGPTETTIYSLIKHITGNEEVITIGRPIDETSIYILNEELQPVAPGEIGELYIGGTGVAAGYVNKPDLTADRFLAANVAGEELIYKTGDLAKQLANDEIQCLGRIDHQVKIRGYRIETEEIESQLIKLTNISKALVTPYTDEAGNLHLVAYIVADQHLPEHKWGAHIDSWKAELGKVLPDYMIPDLFMPIDALPVLPNGKINRSALPRPVIYREGKELYIEPKTPTEKALAAIFLNYIAIDRIGLIDNFFRLGIDSLVMVKIMVQIEKEFGKRYPLSILINYANLNQLGWLIDNDIIPSQYKSLIPIKPKGSKVPLYIVHGIGLNLLNMYNMVGMLDGDQPVYGLQAAGLDGSLEHLNSIEELARFYNSEILLHDPVGPYAISGYSFGGYIAYEIVRQLKALGKDVKMLAMFDTNLQTSTFSSPLSKKLRVKGGRQFKKLFFRLGTMVTSPIATAKYLWEQTPMYLRDTLKLAGIKIASNPDDVPEYMRLIINKLKSAINHYKFEPQDVKIDLFKAAIKMYYVDDPKYFGWKNLAKKGVDVHVVPGDHHHMFEAPNDKVLARELQQQLNEIN